MPSDAMIADPCAHRYFDYPRPGSIYTLPDIPSLVRGPTVVLLPSGKEIRVPAQMKQMVASPAETHDVKDGQNKMQDLIKRDEGDSAKLAALQKELEQVEKDLSAAEDRWAEVQETWDAANA